MCFTVNVHSRFRVSLSVCVCVHCCFFRTSHQGPVYSPPFPFNISSCEAHTRAHTHRHTHTHARTHCILEGHESKRVSQCLRVNDLNLFCLVQFVLLSLPWFVCRALCRSPPWRPFAVALACPMTCSSNSRPNRLSCSCCCRLGLC